MAKYETRKVLTEKLSRLEKERNILREQHSKGIHEHYETRQLLKKSREALTLVSETHSAHIKDLKETIDLLQRDSNY